VNPYQLHLELVAHGLDQRGDGALVFHAAALIAVLVYQPGDCDAGLSLLQLFDARPRWADEIAPEPVVLLTVAAKVFPFPQGGTAADDEVFRLLGRRREGEA